MSKSTPDLAIPTLPSRSLPVTLAFYARLGFAGRVLGAGDAYAILTRGSVELHFFAHPALRPAESHAGCYVRVADVEAAYRAFAAAALPGAGIPRMDALADKPWGMREFAVVDPDGNLLRIGQVRSGATLSLLCRQGSVLTRRPGEVRPGATPSRPASRMSVPE